MHATGHKTGKMRHIDQQIGANLISNRPEFGEINLARHSRTTCNDHFGFVLAGEGCDLIIIDQVVLLAHAILHWVKPFA